MRTLLVVLACLLTLETALAQPGQEAPPDQTARMRAMVHARNITMAVMIYSNQHTALPPDVKTLADLGILPAEGEVGEGGHAWVVDGVAYEYLGVAGVSPGEVPDWGDVAIAHRALGSAFGVEPAPDNPDGLVVPVAFLDGHVEMVSTAEARWLIEDARETFAALRDGGAMPPHRQIEIDAGRLAGAMVAYASEHEGLAPPDWAATFEHLSASARNPEETDADRLWLYLSPRSRGTTFIPGFDATPAGRAERDAWINANSMWRTDAAGANLGHVPDRIFTVLLYAKPDAWVEAPDRRQRRHVRRHAYATVDTRGEMADLDVLEPRIEAARALYGAMRDGSPLPPLDDAMHDLRVLSRAIFAYARANDGLLPPDLAAVVPHIDGLWGVHAQQPARVFLIRGDENERSVDALPDAEWIARHCSYVYLGDGRVRMRDLRGSGVAILLHAPLDRPFDFTALGDRRPRVPFAGPMFSADPAGLPMFMFPPESLAEEAEASGKAIEALAGK
jgi:prepilin-type processing-associated H-X9-DG protein